MFAKLAKPDWPNAGAAAAAAPVPAPPDAQGEARIPSCEDWPNPTALGFPKVAAGAADPKALDPKAPPVLGAAVPEAAGVPQGDAFWPSCAEDPKAGAAALDEEKGDGPTLEKGDAVDAAGAGTDPASPWTAVSPG